MDWLLSPPPLLQAESVQACHIRNKPPTSLGFAESEQVPKGRTCPQLSCLLPQLATWPLAHLPPSHEAVQAVRFLSTLGIRLSHFIDEKSKARRRNVTCKSELIMTAHFKHFEQKQYMINSTFRASRGGLPSQVHRAPQSTVPGCGCWPLCLGLRAAPRAAHRGCGNLGSCLLGAIPSVEGTTLCTPTAPADISLHLTGLAKET